MNGVYGAVAGELKGTIGVGWLRVFACAMLIVILHILRVRLRVALHLMHRDCYPTWKSLKANPKHARFFRNWKRAKNKVKRLRSVLYTAP